MQEKINWVKKIDKWAKSNKFFATFFILLSFVIFIGSVLSSIKVISEIIATKKAEKCETLESQLTDSKNCVISTCNGNIGYAEISSLKRLINHILEIETDIKENSCMNDEKIGLFNVEIDDSIEHKCHSLIKEYNREIVNADSLNSNITENKNIIVELCNLLRDFQIITNSGDTNDYKIFNFTINKFQNENSK